VELALIVNWIEDFVAEDNIDYMAGPVGLKYWILFPFRCQFKPSPGQLPSNAAINLNCKVGIGLEAALGWTLLVLLIGLAVSILLMPASLLTTIGSSASIAFVAFVIVMPAVAWHYSPRCWLMSPAIPLGFSGVTLPLIPISFAPPAIPFCVLSEFRALFDKYITTCYTVLWDTPLEILFPRSLIRGDPCPSCPNRVVFDKCSDLGFSNGALNMVYMLNHFWPESARLFRELGSWWIFSATGPLGAIFVDTGALFERVNNLSSNEMAQYAACNKYTILSVAGFIIGAIFFYTLVGVLWTLFLDGVRALFAVIAASPFIYLIPGFARDIYADYIGEAAPDGSQIPLPQGEDDEQSSPRDDDDFLPSPYIGVRFSDTRDARSRRIPVPLPDRRYQAPQQLRHPPPGDHVFGWVDGLRRRATRAYDVLTDENA